MDKKQQDKTSHGAKLSAAEQQAQLAMLQQLGIPLDPSLLAYGLPSIPMAAGAYPFMNPAALQAFAGMGGLGGQGGTGSAEWWNLAQNQVLAASLGTGYFPGLLPGFPMVPTNISQENQSSRPDSASKSNDTKKKSLEKMSPRPESFGQSVSNLHNRKKSDEYLSSSSKDRPSSHQSTSSPFHGPNIKHPDLKSLPSWMDGINDQRQQKIDEQVFQAELMRQLEQQFLLQQLQIQQQQRQQDQFSAALQSVMGGNVPSTSSNSHKKASFDGKSQQQQLAEIMQQFTQAGGTSSSSLQGFSPSMAASLLSTPGTLETMMGMSQMGKLNAFQSQENMSSSSPPHRQYVHSPSKSQKHTSSLSPGLSKKKLQSSSPHKSQRNEASVVKKSGFSIPELPGAELSPDNALLAMLYSQQLQYEELIKQQMEAVEKLREEEAKSSNKNSYKFKSINKQESFDAQAESSSHNHTGLHSPANSSSSRGKAHTSPVRDYSSSPLSKLREPERSQSRGSSTKHLSPASRATSSKNHKRENVSDTLKLFSTLASNPNMAPPELAALLGLPANSDPASLLSGMVPAQLASSTGLIDPLANSKLTPQIEKVNKESALALALERQKLEEQVKLHRRHIEGNRKKGKEKDNHVSVIHQNDTKGKDFETKPSSSQDVGGRVHGKRSSGDLRNLDRKFGNGDAPSSDGDAKSEANTDKNSYGKTMRKRRRVITDEDEVMEPLKHGWKREVRFKFTGNQLRGEVIYTAPEGKKFRTYPDVIKHLEDNKISHLHRNNFSFSSRLRIGSFYEQKDKDKGNRQWVEITEEELERRVQLLDRGQSSSPFLDNSDRMSNYSSSSKGDSKSSKKEKDKEKEIQKGKLIKELVLEQQEELRKLEQQRIEREIRERLALEELERQRMAEAVERDQRRQQMLLMRALECRKRAEERERRREEIRIEKMMQREKKMEQRRIAMQIARELKMPVEDMATIGAPDLPDLTRLQGTYDNKCPHQLNGNACADVLMVLEFVKTFKECMRLDDTVIPSLEQLQLGLLNDPTHTPALVQLTMALLHQCLCDPGVPAPGPWLHCLTGVKVTDIDVKADNYSEILRLFIWARSGHKTEIAVQLEKLPFLSLTADEKATSLAFLVNELVCSRPICAEIEKNLDTLATLRRDKWMVEGQMRQLRVAYEKNPVDSPITKMEDEESSNSSLPKNAFRGEEVKDEPQEENTESVFQKRMEELTQQHNSYNSQLAHNSKPLRALDLGQDRYKRRYWVLPNLGGVYVEGLESGIGYEDDDESPDEDEEDEEVELRKLTMDRCLGQEVEEEPAGTENAKNGDAFKEVVTNTQYSEEDKKQLKNHEISKSVDCEVMDVSPPKTKEYSQFEASAVKCDGGNQISNGHTLSSTDTANSINLSSASLSTNRTQPVTATFDSSSLPVHHNPAEEITGTNSSYIPESGVENTKNDSQNTKLLHSENELGRDTETSDNDVSGMMSVANKDDPQLNTDVNSSVTKLQTTESTNKINLASPSVTTSPKHKNTHPDTNGDQFKPKSRLLVSEENDSVLAAAKAIAAKAVASSSHLLFPRAEIKSSNKSKCKSTEVGTFPELPRNTKPDAENPEEVTDTLPIGEHTITALVQMGVNPASLTSQQLEVLSHLDTPVTNHVHATLAKENIKIDCGEKTDDSPRKTTTEELQLSSKTSIETKKCSSDEARKTSTEDQDAPMDLSCPASSRTSNQIVENKSAPSLSSSGFSPAKSNSVKVETPASCTQVDSPFVPVRDSPDCKLMDSKFFVPISFNNVKTEQQQHNQVLPSCPSPNTLANYIVSSVNYGQFSVLDDIRFPIRAPDVKAEPNAIPRERKRGWWRIESEGELRSLSQKLHLRGIREKQLHRNITKNFEICTNSMSVSGLAEHQFATLTKDSPSKKNSESKEKLTEVEKVKKTTRSSSQERKMEDIPSRFFSPDKQAFECEMLVLYQVENLAARCVEMGVVSAQWQSDNPMPSAYRKDLAHVTLGPLRDNTGSEIKFDITNPIQHDPTSALGAAVEFVGRLERAVCRRYLKPPLVRKGGATEFSSLPSLSESGAMDVAAGLRTWRNAVASSASASQLALCIRMLESCIAWDKSANQSPVKVDGTALAKGKKRKTDKRTILKVTASPGSPSQAKKRRKKRINLIKSEGSLEMEGKKIKRMPIDTADVISKCPPSGQGGPVPPLLNGDITDHGVVSNMEIGEIANSYDDSLASVDSNTESTLKNCLETTGLGSPDAALQYHANSDNISEEYRPSSEVKKKKKKKKKSKSGAKDDTNKKTGKPKKKVDKETIICRGVLKELQSHEDATWFLFPVDCKLVPGYRKIIKKPIDFHTIECRLKRGRYKTKEDFVSEVRLVFDNCQKFNEDDSNIGRAGHQIRDFFERRWADILRDKFGETVAIPEQRPAPAKMETDSVQELELAPQPTSYPDLETGLVMDES